MCSHGPVPDKAGGASAVLADESLQTLGAREKLQWIRINMVQGEGPSYRGLLSPELRLMPSRSIDGQKTWPCAEAIRAKLIFLFPEKCDFDGVPPAGRRTAPQNTAALEYVRSGAEGAVRH